MGTRGSVANRVISIIASITLVLTLCPTALFAAAGEALAAPSLQAASTGDSTVVASGTYNGYGATTGGELSYNYGPTYTWTLYESGLLSIDLSTYHTSGSEASAQSPGWKEHAESITSVDMTASYGFYHDYSSSYYYHSTITSYMFSGLSNLTTVNAPKAKIVTSGAFRYCPNLQSVTLGTDYMKSSSNTSSGNNLFLHSSAFSYCRSLNEINIGGRYTHAIFLNSSSFEGCTSLATVNLTSATGTVGNRAFAGCTALRNVDVHTMDTSIGTSAFEGCTRLRSVTLPASTSTASYFASNAFKDCTALESIAVPSGVNSLSDSVFEGCSKLNTVTFPSSLRSVGASAFKDCSALATAVLPTGLTSVAAYAFNGCSSLKSVNLGASLTSIGQYAYTGSGITDIQVPAKIATLTSNAFNDCDDLEAVVVASGVKSLAASSFAGCDALATVTLPDTLVTLAANTFANCPNLSQVWFQGDAPTIADTTFSGDTIAALYPIDNEYWGESDMADYGGTLSWSPYGDVSACSLVADDLAYTGTTQQAMTHLVAANGMEVSRSLYTVSYFADADCTSPLDEAEVKLPGTYYVKAAGVDAQHCTGIVGPAAFEITKAPLTISYESETVDYGATPAYRIVYEGFVGGDDESVLAAPATLSTPSTLASGHSYTLTPEGAAADNYDITYESGVLAVNPAYIDKPACASNLVYTGKDQAGVAPGEGYALSGTTHAVNAGKYEAIIELEDGYAWADGSLDPLTYTWTIGKAPLVAAFVDEEIDAGATPALQVSVTGFVEGEAAGSAAGYSAPTASVTSTLKPGYSHTAIVAGGTAANYTFTYKSGKVTVRPIVVEIPDTTLSFTYDGEQKTALNPGDGYNLTGVWQATNAGAYSVTATLRDGYQWADGTTAAKRYSWSIAAAPGSLSIDKSELSLSIGESGSATVRYVGDGKLSAVSSDTSVATVSLKQGKLEVGALSEGTARITVTSSACTNHTTPAPEILSVTVESTNLAKCTIEATGGAYTGKAFDAKVRVLNPDGSELAPASSHNFHYYDSASCDNEISAQQVLNAGTYWVRAEAVSGGKSSGRTNAVPFNIEKAMLTATYASETVDYGTQPSGKVNVSGFVAGESASTAKGYTAPTVTLPSPLNRATDYELVPAGGYADNYAFVYKAGTLSVKRQAIAVPTAKTGLTYSGASRTGVAVGAGYTLSGTYAATDAGSYTATATLEEGCVWADGTTASKSIRWTISATDIAKVRAPSLSSQTYTGSAMQLRPELTLGDYVLVLGKDYTLSYSDNRNAGTATITVTGKGNFTNTRTLAFKITQRSLSSGTIGGIAPSYPYTGASITPTPTVTCDGSTLENGVDYTVEYANNVGSGTATVYVYGKGNYSGTLRTTFKVAKTSLEYATIADLGETTYTGSAITVEPSVSIDGNGLVKDRDYSVSYAGNVNAGIATATFTGKGNVTGSAVKHFVIRPASIAQATVSGVDASYVYRGAEIRPVPVVSMGEKTLVAGVDYAMSYSDNAAVGEASVSIVGMGNYTGSTTASFAITKAPYDLSRISLAGATVTYDGTAHSLAVDGEVPDGVSVAYTGNYVVEAGEHVVTATFTDDEAHEVIGSMSATLVIEKAYVEVPRAADGLVYSGKTQHGLPESNLYSLEGNDGINVGSYEAIARLSDPDNYQWADASTADKVIAWSIAKAPLIAYYVGDAITYGDSPALRVEVSGFVNGENASRAAGFTLPTVSAVSNNAGSYRLVPRGGSANNYKFEYRAGTLSIAKAVAVVVADSAMKPYGTSDPAFTYSVLGAPASAISRVALNRVAGEDVGEYAIVVSASDTSNYRVVGVGAKLTIVPAAYDMSSVYFRNEEVTYDGRPHSIYALNLPDGVHVTYDYDSFTDAGTHVVSAYFTGDANHLPINPMHTTLTIYKASVDVPSANWGLSYTGALQIGVAAGDGYNVTGGSAVDAGGYVAVAALADGNYQWSDGTTSPKEIDWYIHPKYCDESRIAFPSASFTYDGKPHSLSIRGLPDGIRVTYENNAAIEVGTYTVTAHLQEEPNYGMLSTSEYTATLTITPAANSTPSAADSLVFGSVSVADRVYTGKPQLPPVTVWLDGAKLRGGRDYSVSYSNNVRAGVAKVTVRGTGRYFGATTASFVIVKAANPMKAKGKKATAKVGKLKKKAVKLAMSKALAVSKAQGKVVVKKLAGSKKVLVSKTGKVTLKKGLKKGTYKIMVRVTAKGNANYKALSKIVVFTVKVR